MPKATSKAQFKLMQGICNGSVAPKNGLTTKQACEFIQGQSPKGLPKKVNNKTAPKKAKKGSLQHNTNKKKK